MSQGPNQQTPPVVEYASRGAEPPRFRRGLLGWVLFIGLAVMLFLVLQTKNSQWARIPLSEAYTQLEKGNVAEVVLDRDSLRLRLIATTGNLNSVHCQADLPQGIGTQWSFVNWLMENRKTAVVRVDNNQNLLLDLLLPVVPWLLIFAFVWFFIFRQLRQSARQQQDPKPLPVYIVNPEQK